jgi:nitrogen fixation NifU-like protein
MSDPYRDAVLDHYKYPRNYGKMDDADLVASDENISCGDRITIYIKLSEDKTIIEKMMFTGEGCAIDQASASMLTEKVQGMSLPDILALRTENILDLLGTSLTPSRIKCAVLPLEVLQKALLEKGE